jgi:hypothetical protein
MDALDNESFDFLRGYHRAMADVAAKCLEATKDAQAAHEKARPRFFGGPSSDHFLALGRGRASKAIGDFAHARGLEAFHRRKSA